MDFVSPLYLLALGAAAVPLWLHLRKLRTERRVVFPPIRYLRRARQAYAQRLQLRHWLLLAARLALVALLAFVAAGVLWGHGAARDHPPTRVALVLDNSISTSLVRGDRPYFELLRERALTSVAWANPEDRFWIVLATSPEESAGPLSPAEAEGRLRALEPVPAPGADLGRAAARAASLVSGAGAAEVHVLSDLQASNWGESLPLEGVRLAVLAPEEDAPANLAVTEVRSVQSPAAAGQEVLLVARVERFGGEEADTGEVTVRAASDGRVVSLSTARPGAEVTMVLPAAPGGWIRGHVEIDPSGLRADDRRFFAVPVRPPARVAVLGEPGPFVEAALSALANGGRARRVRDASGADVVWAQEGEGIAEALRAGRAAVVVPGEDPLALPRLNARLARAGLPWRYAYDPSPGIQRLGPGAEWIPAAAGLAVRQSYRLEPERPGAGRVPVQLESGEPWVVAAEPAGAGRALLLASPLTPQGTDLVAAPAMIPFVDALLNGWPGEGGGLAGADEEGRVPLPPRATAVETPSGDRLPVEGGGWLRHASEPGVYRIWVRDSVVDELPLNPPALESDLTPVRASEIERRWRGARRADARSEAQWEDAIFAVRRGREASAWLLVTLLLLAVVESAAAAGGRTRPAAARRPELLETRAPTPR